MNEQNIQQLRDLLVREFNEDELTALCRDIGLNYTNLPGVGSYGKTREIMTAVQEQHLVRTLMNRVQQLRPTQYLEAGLESVEPEKPLPPGQSAANPPLTGRQQDGKAAGAATVALSNAMPGSPQSNTPASSASSTSSPISATAGKSTPEPGLIKEAPKTMDTGGSRKSALPLRVRLIGFIIVVLLLAVAVLSIVLQPRKGGTPLSPPPTTAVTLLPASGAITTTGQLSPAMTTQAATPQPIQVDATPMPAGTVSETHPAAVAIRSINDTLVAWYGGKAKTEDFKPDFAAAKYQVIINFAYKTLKAKLGADMSKGDTLNVTLRYDKIPTLTAEKNGVATVVTKEYWVYTNAANSKSYCDNSEYTYTLSKVGDIYQVKDLRSRSISAKCE